MGVFSGCRLKRVVQNRWWMLTKFQHRSLLVSSVVGGKVRRQSVRIVRPPFYVEVYAHVHVRFLLRIGRAALPPPYGRCSTSRHRDGDGNSTSSFLIDGRLSPGASFARLASFASFL